MGEEGDLVCPPSWFNPRGEEEHQEQEDFLKEKEKDSETQFRFLRFIFLLQISDSNPFNSPPIFPNVAVILQFRPKIPVFGFLFRGNHPIDYQSQILS